MLLKMDALQPTGSFKDRGMGHFCESLKRSGARGVISSSGGNAGCAVANAARILSLECVVIVPETTKAVVVERMRGMGAEVSIHGANWNAADAEARRRQLEQPTMHYVHPFDHETIWTGHASIVEEIAAEMAADVLCGGSGSQSGVETVSTAEAATRPDAIVVCVGGGGLLCGVYEGLAARGWGGVPVIAVETEGAASFARARAWGDGSLAAQKASPPLAAIDSIATSLGALKVAEGVLERAEAHGAPTHSVTVSDATAVEACRAFAADHRVLVEPACGAGLSVLYGAEASYSELIRSVLPPRDAEGEGLAAESGSGSEGCIVVVVCGGSGVNLEIMEEWGG